MKEMNKLFGMKERQIERFLSINKLAVLSVSRDDIESMDTNTLAGIGSEDDWSKSKKKEAIEVLSKIDKSEERRNMLSEMKKKISEDKKKNEFESYG